MGRQESPTHSHTQSTASCTHLLCAMQTTVDSHPVCRPLRARKRATPSQKCRDVRWNQTVKPLAHGGEVVSATTSHAFLGASYQVPTKASPLTWSMIGCCISDDPKTHVATAGLDSSVSPSHPKCALWTTRQRWVGQRRATGHLLGQSKASIPPALPMVSGGPHVSGILNFSSVLYNCTAGCWVLGHMII